MARVLIIGVLVLVGIYVGARFVDNYYRDRAHDYIVQNEYFFEENLARAEIDVANISKESETVCFFDKIYDLYGYQFCFFPRTDSYRENEWGYDYFYFSPVPFLSILFPGRNEGDYYFSQIIYGQPVRTIHRNGHIADRTVPWNR